MRRIVSIWFPTWATDRIRRGSNGAPPVDQPLVTKLHDGRRMILAAVDHAARKAGLHAGMPLAHAQAMIPDLTVETCNRKWSGPQSSEFLAQINCD